MLPEQAKAYFNKLLASANGDAWSELSRRQKEFERDEFSRGCRQGSGFAARLSNIYKEDLSQRAKTIAELLIEVHQSFDSPLDEGVDEQLREWGAAALASARDGLEDAYTRHLQGCGLHDIPPIGLEHVYACGQATVANVPAGHLWDLRNVPALRPQHTKEAPLTVNINNSGTIGAVQTGPGATAHVQQLWVEGDTSALRQALGELRDAVERSQEVAPEARAELIAGVDGAVVELQQERPSRAKLFALLVGFGAAVEAIGSLEQAYATVKALAKMVGVDLP